MTWKVTLERGPLENKSWEHKGEQGRKGAMVRADALADLHSCGIVEYVDQERIVVNAAEYYRKKK